MRASIYVRREDWLHHGPTFTLRLDLPIEGRLAELFRSQPEAEIDELFRPAVEAMQAQVAKLEAR